MKIISIRRASASLLYCDSPRVSDLRRLTRKRSRSEVAAVSLSPTQRLPDGGLELFDLDRGIGKLPECQRQALLLVCLEEIGYGQAAAILGVPICTVRSRIARAREALREEFDRPPIRQSRAAAKPDLPPRQRTAPTTVAFNAHRLAADATCGRT